MPIVELFAIGTIGFFLLIAIEIILLFVFTANDNGWGALFSVVGFLAFIEFVSKAHVLQLMRNNPIWVVVFAISYLVIALFWGIFKLRNRAKNRLREYDEKFAQFLVENKLPANTETLPTLELRTKWSRTMDQTNAYRDGIRCKLSDKMLVSDYKLKIIHWMALWPISMLIFFFKDMVVEIFNWMYDLVRGFMQRMIDEMYGKRNIDQNLDLTPPSKEEDSQD